MFNFWSFTFWMIIISFTSLEIFILLKDRKRNVDKDLYRTIWFVGIIIYLVFSLFMCFKTDESHETTTEIVENNILGLSDNYDKSITGKVAGNIIFTYGEIREGKDIYYRFMEGNEEEGYAIKDLKISDDIRLFFIEENSGRIKYHYKIITTNEIPNWYYGELFKNNRTDINEVRKLLKKVELFLPKNSLRVDFTVDLK